VIVEDGEVIEFSVFYDHPQQKRASSTLPRSSTKTMRRMTTWRFPLTLRPRRSICLSPAPGRGQDQLGHIGNLLATTRESCVSVAHASDLRRGSGDALDQATQSPAPDTRSQPANVRWKTTHMSRWYQTLLSVT
jgi:hypothetical protein